MSSERRQIEETERERLLKGEASKQNQYNENRLNGRKGYSRRGRIGGKENTKMEAINKAVKENMKIKQKRKKKKKDKE